ncbi:MAG: DUF4919 domain-containing protein [Alistipes sp.]|nr:DUF4919 domain-containing protein [Alistipes sp.]
MKRVLLLLILITPLAMSAQQTDTQNLRIPDEEDIAMRTMDASSPYYYTNLMLKYRHGTAPLSAEEYYYLYYGYAYQTDYRPFANNAALDQMLAVMAGINPDQPQVGQLESLIEYGTEALEIDPFSPKVLNMMAYAYGALGDTQREQLYFNHLNGVLQTIESTGTGLKENLPWHVLLFSHAYDLLASKGYLYNEGRIISRTVQYVPLKEKTYDKKKGFYFDYSRVYRNKPDDVEIKRDRTWQFNNLKPRKYK